MFAINIFMKHSVNRPLSATDRFYHLDQRERLDCIPEGNRSVVALHDDYLETVDHAYAHKGAIALEYLGMFLLAYLFWQGAAWYSDDSMGGFMPGSDYPILIPTAVMMLLLLPVYLWFLSKEFFVLTYYPIRFERTTRTICMLRRNKTVLRVPWDDVYFTCGHIPELDWWEIRGHVLDWDGETVLDTFVLSCSGNSFRSKEPSASMPRPSPSHDPLLRHWELVRRYMEEGRQAVAPFVERTIPANVRRETVRESFEYCHRGYISPIARKLLLPFLAVRALFRWLALRSCKIPQWPVNA